MKKIFLTSGLYFMLVSLSFADTCDALLAKTNFYSPQLEAIIYYNSSVSNGLSGGITAHSPIYGKAPLEDSHCIKSKVTLKWNQSGFSGNAYGSLVAVGHRLTINIQQGSMNGHSLVGVSLGAEI